MSDKTPLEEYASYRAQHDALYLGIRFFPRTIMIVDFEFGLSCIQGLQPIPLEASAHFGNGERIFHAGVFLGYAELKEMVKAIWGEVSALNPFDARLTTGLYEVQTRKGVTEPCIGAWLTKYFRNWVWTCRDEGLVLRQDSVR